MIAARTELNVISCSAGISACSRADAGQHWQTAVELLLLLQESRILGSRITKELLHCENRRTQFFPAMVQLGSACLEVKSSIPMGQRKARISPNVVSCSAGISACERGSQWQLALDLLSQMPEANAARPLQSTAMVRVRWDSDYKASSRAQTKNDST